MQSNISVPENHFDVIVIGTGPGGEGAAMQAAKEGKRVAIFERYSRIGGGCTHWGTIHSKALRFSIHSIMEAIKNPVVQELGNRPSPTLAQLRSSSRSIIAKQESMRQAFYCMELSDIPTGIYTSPEISSVGRTERELTAAKIPYEMGHSQFKRLARAQITGRTVGMLKLLFHRKSLEILGVHCFGANAAEIVHIGQAIMKQPHPNNTLDYFINTTFNYPTMAEAYRVAALNGYNRLL